METGKIRVIARIDHGKKTAKNFSFNDGFMEFRDECFVLWDAGLILTYAGVVNMRAPATLPGFAPFKAAET
jgi:hypothetical protein